MFLDKTMWMSIIEINWVFNSMSKLVWCKFGLSVKNWFSGSDKFVFPKWCLLVITNAARGQKNVQIIGKLRFCFDKILDYLSHLINKYYIIVICIAKNLIAIKKLC